MGRLCRRVVAATAVLATTMGMMASSVGTARAVSEPYYRSLTEAKIGHRDWMAEIAGTTRLAQMSIPGTHETMAIHCGDAYEAQEDHGDSGRTLAKQLEFGIRAIDIRVRTGTEDAPEGLFTIHHAGCYENATFGDVLNRMSEFLTAHPSETILMRLKAEENNEKDGDGRNPYLTTLEKYLHGGHQDQAGKGRSYKEIFHRPSICVDEKGDRQPVCEQADPPSLGQVRGKVVMLGYFNYGSGINTDYGIRHLACNDEEHGNDNGLGRPGATCWPKHTQDRYNENGGWVPSKRDHVRRHLDNTNNTDPAHSRPAGTATSPDRLYTNWTNVAYNGFVFPYQAARGYVGGAAGTTGVNEFLLKYLTESLNNDEVDPGDWTGHDPPVRVRRTGSVMMDYPGGALIDKIITFNPRSTDTKWRDPRNSTLTAPTPPVDSDPVDHWVPSPGGDQSRCRPEGMAPSAGVSTPYCVAYDASGRERLGPKHEKRTVGYFTGSRDGRDERHPYPVSSIPWGQVTHVNHAFASIDSDNRIAVSADDATVLGQLAENKARHPRVKTLVAVGGWAASTGFYSMTTNPDGGVNHPGIDAFTDSVVTFLRQHRLNGVDIDYEYPTALTGAGNPQDWAVSDPRRAGLFEGYAALLRTLRAKLDSAATTDGTYYLLTAAVSASGYLVRGMANFPVTQYLDYVNLMTYDFHGTWNRFVGPHAPLFDDGRDTELAAAGIYDMTKNPEYDKTGYFNTDWAFHYFRGSMPAGRIVLGAPMYTRGWTNVTGGGPHGMWGDSVLADQSKCPQGTGGNGGGVPCGAGAGGVDNLWHDVDQDGNPINAGVSPMWHAKNLERSIIPSYLGNYGMRQGTSVGMYYPEWDDGTHTKSLWNPDTKTFLSVEDVESVTMLADYINARGAGGAMVWELAGDFDCPVDKGRECRPGYTLITTLADRLLLSGDAYDTSQSTGSQVEKTLPAQIVNVTAEMVNFPTQVKDLWPMQPTLRITNHSGVTIPAGATIAFDLPTSTSPLVKDSAWRDQTQNGDWTVSPGRSGPNVGGLRANFHRVSTTLRYCQGIPNGRSMDIPMKYYLPVTGPSNATLTMGDNTYGLASGNRTKVTQVTPAPTAERPAACQAEPWDNARVYNPVWAPFALWKAGDTWKIQDVNSGNVISHPGTSSTTRLAAKQDGDADQLWTVTDAGERGAYWIKSRTAGHDQCLGAETVLNDLTVRDCDGRDGQRWHLTDEKGIRLTGIPADGTPFGMSTSTRLAAEPRNSGVRPGTALVAGDIAGGTRTVVSHNGHHWKARWWTKATPPNPGDPNSPWARLGPVG